MRKKINIVSGIMAGVSAVLLASAIYFGMMREYVIVSVKFHTLIYPITLSSLAVSLLALLWNNFEHYKFGLLAISINAIILCSVVWTSAIFQNNNSREYTIEYAEQKITVCVYQRFWSEVYSVRVYKGTGVLCEMVSSFSSSTSDIDEIIDVINKKKRNGS